MSKRLVFVLFSLLIIEIFVSVLIRAQTGLVDPRKTEYVCVASRTVKGTDIILVLPCEAADVRQDRLVDADYAAFEKMQLQRTLFDVLKTRPNSDTEVRSTKADFQKLAKEVCERHPKIVLLPLDWKTERSQNNDVTASGGLVLKSCNTL